MSELSSMPDTVKKIQLSGICLPLFLLSYFLLYKLTYFLPYLLNLLHFLSPLLITTFLVFLFTSYKALIEKPAARLNDAEKEDQEVYNIFFEAASQFDQTNRQVLEESQPLIDKFLICVNDANEDRNPPPEKTTVQVVPEDEKDIDADSTKVGRESKDEKMSMTSVGSYGSMSVDKEWKRTLACKLFEERHKKNCNESIERDEEGMDLLWEAYEENSFSAKGQIKKRLEKKGSVSSAKSSLRYKDMAAVENDDDDEDVGGKICCLQALKFSAGKVNLGMGRSNIGRLSKAFRGLGWLHHVSSSKKVSSPLKPKAFR